MCQVAHSGNEEEYDALERKPGLGIGALWAHASGTIDDNLVSRFSATLLGCKPIVQRFCWSGRERWQVHAVAEPHYLGKEVEPKREAGENGANSLMEPPLMLHVTKNTSILWFVNQNCSVFFTRRRGSYVIAIEFRRPEGRSSQFTGRDPANGVVMVWILLLVNIRAADR